MTSVAAPARAAEPSVDLRNYALVTGAYWADTLTDGALRMVVLLYFHERGYSAVQVAMLFLLYEVFGVVTNLVGGWVAARLGLKATLFAGLGTQLAALAMLAAPPGVADSAVRHGGEGAVGHRQGPDEDELQERGEAAGGRGSPFRAVQVGRRPHRLEERT